MLSWSRFEHEYVPTAGIHEGIPEHRSTELNRLGGLGMHQVRAGDDFWRYLGPTSGWAISFTDTRFILWDPDGHVELEGSAADAGVDPTILAAIAEKVRADGEIVLFSGNLLMTDEGPEIQEAREAGNLLSGAAVYIETLALQ